MRAVVLVVIVLAALKVWAHDRVYRRATEDAIVAAYRERAIATCQSSRPRVATGFVSWTSPASITLAIGRPDVDVAIWDVDDPRWGLRWSYPRLIVAPEGGGGREVCAYDITLDTAAFERR